MAVRLVRMDRAIFFGALSRVAPVIGYEFSLEDNLADVKVDGYSTATLNFSDQDHFEWGPKTENDLYLKVSIVGRKRPLWFWVQLHTWDGQPTKLKD